jgi:hypothetical protein
MKVWDRYAEYAIIGGLFWIGMFIAVASTGIVDRIAIVGNTASLLNSGISLLNQNQFSTESKQALYSVITSLLSALSIIAVFCTGMLIDVISPIFFTPFEIFYFKRYLVEKNCNYVEKVFEEDKSSSMYTDYVLFSTSPILFSRHKYFSQWPTQRHRYIKLLALLISYCLKNSETGVLEELKDRLVLWRTGRSLGSSIFLVAIIINCLSIVPSRGIDKHLLIGFFIIIALWIVSGLLAMGQYMRMCHTLRSIMYLSFGKDTSIK